jgi:hypothetical protein
MRSPWASVWLIWSSKVPTASSTSRGPRWLCSHKVVISSDFVTDGLLTVERTQRAWGLLFAYDMLLLSIGYQSIRGNSEIPGRKLGGTREKHDGSTLSLWHLATKNANQPLTPLFWCHHLLLGKGFRYHWFAPKPLVPVAQVHSTSTFKQTAFLVLLAAPARTGIVAPDLLACPEK